MLGYLRFFLALMVVGGHLGGWAGGIDLVGPAAMFSVFGFYVISGFLITRILNETYSFNFPKFALNRILRLYPTHYMVAAVALVIILTVPGAVSWHPAWKPNGDLITWLCNLLIFPIAGLDVPFLVTPPTWSVAVELVNYFILWALVGRSYRAAIAGLVVSIVYHGWSLAEGHPWGARYTPFIAAMLPFSIGAIIYLQRGFLVSHLCGAWSRLAALVFGVWLLNIAFARQYAVGDVSISVFFYVSLLLIAALVCVISVSKAGSLPGHKMLGDMAYPMFLSHWIVGFVVGHFLLPERSFGNYGISLISYSMPIIMAVSFVLAWAAGKFIEPLRDRIRPIVSADA